MAAFSPIDKATLFQNNVLYTGNGTAIGSGGQAITGVGFSADFTWLKERSSTSGHHWFDTPRGATEKISSDSQAAESANAETLASWQSDGFTVGNAGGANESGQTYVAWNWKAGTTSGLSGGTITPSAYSINTTSKFGIYKYTGNGSAGATIAHGLGATPYMIIVKRLTNTYDWAVQTPYTHATDSQEYILRINTTDGSTQDDAFNNTLATSTVVTLGASTYTNATSADQEYVMYAWAPVNGFSDIGKYSGIGDSNGPMVYTGFKPSFVLIKRSNSSGGNWWIWDNKRLGYNPDNDNLYADITNAEDQSGRLIDIFSNGFKLRSADNGVNGSGNTYNYMAFGQSLVASNGIITTAK